MQETTMTKLKIFTAWQDEKEEAWLRKKAQEGWHLSSFVLPCVYRFQRGEPRDIVYRLDFVTSRTPLPDYLQLFEDAGWEHLGSMMGWQYFRKPASAAGANEIYTDPQSKVQKYRRLLGYLAIFLPVMVVTLIANRGAPSYGFIPSWRFFVFMVFLIMMYGFARIAMRIRQLERM